jgi:hypothetical protein
MVARYETALANRSSGAGAEGIDHDLVRRVARSELKEATAAQSGENVLTMMRRIGQAKAELAADYAAQTIDARIAGLIDSKAGLAARALDGSDQQVSSSADVQLEALAALLTDTLRASFGHGNALGS